MILQKKKLKNKLIRISKLISHAGICSRKEAELLIKNSKVKINDKIFKGFFISSEEINNIKVNNKIIKKIPTKVWILNKPEGYVCSNKEQFSQKSIFRLLPNNFPRVVTVGRLDISSDGLIILTNNPTLSAFLELPKNQINRIYKVKVFGNINSRLEGESKKQLFIDGILYKNFKVKILTNKPNNNILEICLTEGKNREIRKILEYFNLKVKKLTRISFGPFKLNNMNKGEITELNYKYLEKILKSLNFKNENNFW